MKNKNNLIIMCLSALIVICLTCGTLGCISHYKSTNLDKNETNNKENQSNVKETKYKLTIIPNGSQVSETELTCIKENNKCIVTLPEITREGYSIEGYTEKEKDTKAQYKPLEKINLKKDKTLYVLTSKEIAVKIDPYLETKWQQNLTCKIYNSEESCKIKLPKKEEKDGWTLDGFDKNSWWREDMDYKAGEEIEVKEDLILISMSSKDLTINIDTTGIEKIKENPVKVKIHNDINFYQLPDFPEMTEKEGFLFADYDGHSSCREDCTIKPPYLLENVKIKKTYKFGATKVEVQDTVNNISELEESLKDVYKNWPWIFKHTSKIMYLDDTTYNTIDEKFNTSSSGITLYNGNIALRYARKSTLVHELAHRIYFNHGMHRAASSNEVRELNSLYNKYNYEDCPYLYWYARTNNVEFFAVAVEYYYKKYVDKEDIPYPDDLKEFIERYLN